jgi:hypothetical protein
MRKLRLCQFKNFDYFTSTTFHTTDGNYLYKYQVYVILLISLSRDLKNGVFVDLLNENHLKIFVTEYNRRRS